MKIVDARGLQHPEPFERVVEALTELALGDQIKLIIHQEPRPLYRFLERNRYANKNTLLAICAIARKVIVQNQPPF